MSTRTSTAMFIFLLNLLIVSVHSAPVPIFDMAPPSTNLAFIAPRQSYSHWHHHHHTQSSSVVPTATTETRSFTTTTVTSSFTTMTNAPASTGTASTSTGKKTSSATATSASPTASSPSALDGPRFVIYSDKSPGGNSVLPDVGDIAGYNVFILSFLLSSGAADQAASWAALSSSERSTLKSQYSAAGVKLMVSAFGSTETPTTSGLDPVDTANTMAAWVKQFGLDGIDVDYEDFTAMGLGDGSAENWLNQFTTQLRSNLPSGEYIITHAPVAPWFTTDTSIYPSGAYLAIDKAVGSQIDWYNVQFYNQGSTEYTTCDNLMTTSSKTWPNTAVFEINSAGGVELNKIVVGKPGDSSDASDGFIEPTELASCVQQAQNQGWQGGVMVWEYPDADASWISSVRSLSWAV